MDMTIEQAMKVAAELEEKGCLNEPAKAARTLRKHILASPQVTDEQIKKISRELDAENNWDDVKFARAVLALSAPPAAESPHSDDIAVQEFATAMIAKMAEARTKGRRGWEECDPAELSQMLREHVEKGDPRDVANFCMMLWHQQEPIAAPRKEAKPVAADGWQVVPKMPTQEMLNVGYDGHGPRDVYNRMLAAAPQEQAPADKDAIRNATLEEAAKIALQYCYTGGGTDAAKAIRALQSQPHQVAEGD